jgi:DNA invertase Pin-like site-specific DNA recombinase
VTTKRRIGIAKGSDQDVLNQEKALHEAGCDKIIRVVRGENIKALLRPTDKNVQSGDTIVVQNLNVLSTSSINLSRRFRHAAAKGVTLEILEPPFTTESLDVQNMLKAWLELYQNQILQKRRRNAHELRPEGALRIFSASDWPRIKSELETETVTAIAARNNVTRQTVYTFIKRMKQLEEQPSPAP